MIVLFAVVALLVIGLAVALAFGGLARMSVRRSDPVATAAGRGLPGGRILSDDLDDVRFDIALRGYRMDQVDEVIDRLRLRLAEYEEDSSGRAPGLPFLVGDESGGGTSMAAFPPVWNGDPHRGSGRASGHPVQRMDDGTAPGVVDAWDADGDDDLRRR